MGTSDDDHLHDELLQVKESELYTGDGSVDVNGKPVLKSKTGKWKACLFIFGTQSCNCLANTGIDLSLVTYLTQQLHYGNASAARIANTSTGTSCLAPLVGAFLADSYWGRYRTISVFSFIYITGLSALALSAIFPAFQPADSASTFPQYALFFVGLYSMAVGTGGMNPCVPTFGADQFDDTDSYERIKKGSYFNWLVFSSNLGSIISSSLLVWIQENVGWGIGYGIPVLCMAVALASFFSGTRFYRFQRPGGSPLTGICQVIVASIRKRKLNIPLETSLLCETSDVTSRKLEHTEGLEFLDKAAVMTTMEMETRELSNPWRLCTITQVEQLKILIRLVPICATGIIDTAAHSQKSTTFIEQGMVMDRKIGSFTIPAASLATCAVLSSLVWIPLCEKTIVPLVRRLTRKEKGFSSMQSIGIGLSLTVISMIIATLVETRRLQVAKEPGWVPLSILWQVPQYVILGISDVFTSVGRMELLYEEAPESMRSKGAAIGVLIISLGCYLSPLVLFIVTSITTAGGKPGWVPDDLNVGRLNNYLGFWAAFSFLNLLLFVLCAIKYKQKVLKIHV